MGDIEKIYSRRGRCKLPLFCKRSTIIVVVIVMILTFVIAIRTINPIIESLCVDKAKNLATKVCNEEASRIMQNYKYEDFVNIMKDDNDNIILIQTNAKTVNEVASDIPNKIVEELEKQSEDYISIHMGSILGNKFFMNWGPEIKIKIESVGNVETELKSEFSSQGINQTLHRIYLNLTCEVTILTPYDTINQKIENQVLIAESVIVGNVPASYYNFSH